MIYFFKDESITYMFSCRFFKNENLIMYWILFTYNIRFTPENWIYVFFNKLSFLFLMSAVLLFTVHLD